MILQFLFAILLTSACNTSGAQENGNKNKGVQFGGNNKDDTTSVTVIQFDQKRSWPFPKDYTPTTLSKKEIETLDSLIKAYTKKYNDSLKGYLRKDYGVDFDKFKYKRQYIPVVNREGEIEVWANFFCVFDGQKWQTEIILVQDGGNCFFRLKVNLSTKICYSFLVNGYS